MKKRKGLLVLLLTLPIISGGCQNRCDVRGEWFLAGTRNHEGEFYSHDRISFSNDSVTLASGFFYPVIDRNNFDEWKSGRYPFVYYGNRERYKVVGDSLYIYNAPYSEWEIMKIMCDESGKLRLIGKNREWQLVRKDEVHKSGRQCRIEYIKAHVYEFEDVGNYAINYRVTYSNDDKLVYQQLSKADDDHVLKTFQLKPGTFAEICQGFDNVSVTQIQNKYEARVSEPEIIELELGLENGQVIHSRIESPGYPEELKLALIPVLYLHQRLAYPDLKPVDFGSKKR